MVRVKRKNSSSETRNSIIERCAQCFDGESRRVLFARGQPAERAYELLPCQSHGLFDGHPFYHLREYGATGERRGAAVGEKSRGLYASFAQAHGEAQPVTTDGIGLLCDGRRVRQFAHAARVG